MRYTLVWEEHALSELRRLRPPDPEGAKECLAAIRSLASDPEAASALGGSGFFRLAVGSWRVLYEVLGEQVTVRVLKVGRAV